jgi:toxin ParE1/3/4
MPADLKGYKFFPRAQQDLEAIWLYTFQQWSSVQADSYVSDILSACERLSNGEKVGLNAADVRLGYWKYFSGSHVIYYRISDHYLTVVRILHQSRDVDKHLME